MNQEADTDPQFHYSYLHFREHLKRWLFQGATPDLTKDYLREFYPEESELEWKQVRFYEALAYTEALLKQAEKQLEDYWYPREDMKDSYLSGYLVLAVWALMAHVPKERLFEYPSIQQVMGLARKYWVDGLSHQADPTHQISPEIASSGPPRSYPDEDFREDIYKWLDEPLDIEEMKHYFLMRYPDHNEARWKFRRILSARQCLRDHNSFPEFRPGERALIIGVWRYFGGSTHGMLDNPDLEEIRNHALQVRREME